MKKPIARETTTTAIASTVFILVAAAALIVWLDPAPNPKAPECSAGEIAVAAKREWFCVAARKP